MDPLIQRAKEYLTDKYLDVADVPLFIARMVELHEANLLLQQRIKELEFDVSDVSDKRVVTIVDNHPTCNLCKQCVICYWCKCDIGYGSTSH